MAGFHHGSRRTAGCHQAGVRLLLGMAALAAGLVPLLGRAQAGSSEPIVFYAADQVSGGSAGSTQLQQLPKGVLKLSREERYLLWVELDEGRLKILEQNAAGGLELRQVIPVSIGKNGFGKQREGDRKTPVGIYRLTSFLPDETLIDFYGLGAFTLNYPNVSDRRAGRTGSGIWLHGLPKDIDQRPLLDSDGCVVIDNDSLAAMGGYISPGVTHMMLSAQPLEWVPKQHTSMRRAGLEQAFESWRLAWEDRDNEAYLAFYAEDFNDFIRNRQQWAVYKTRVNNSKSFIRIGASNISFYADPTHPELVTVRYYQDYDSNNYSWRGWKEQLWRESGEHWQIVYEGNG